MRMVSSLLMSYIFIYSQEAKITSRNDWGFLFGILPSDDSVGGNPGRALPADEFTETIHTEVQVLPLSLPKSSFPGVSLYY